MNHIGKTITKGKVTPWQELDGKILVLTPQKNSVHELNDTASFIWKQIDGQKSTDQIASLIADEFDVSEDIAKNDFMDFVAEMKKEGLIDDNR